MMQFMDDRHSRAMMDMARARLPREVCGFVLEDWSLHQIDNIAVGDSEFEMDHQQTIDFYIIHERSMVGMFHSHPSGTERPSQSDINNAPDGLRYFIVTSTSVTEWSICHGGKGSQGVAHQIYRFAA